jgi:hypothetical protein
MGRMAPWRGPGPVPDSEVEQERRRRIESDPTYDLNAPAYVPVNKWTPEALMERRTEGSLNHINNALNTMDSYKPQYTATLRDYFANPTGELMSSAVVGGNSAIRQLRDNVLAPALRLDSQQRNAVYALENGTITPEQYATLTSTIMQQKERLPSWLKPEMLAQFKTIQSQNTGHGSTDSEVAALIEAARSWNWDDIYNQQTGRSQLPVAPGLTEELLANQGGGMLSWVALLPSYRWNG